jgi:hypothetical protein
MDAERPMPRRKQIALIAHDNRKPGIRLRSMRTGFARPTPFSRRTGVFETPRVMGDRIVGRWVLARRPFSPSGAIDVDTAGVVGERSSVSVCLAAGIELSAAARTLARKGSRT